MQGKVIELDSTHFLLFLWIPFLTLIYRFYARRNIWAIVILLISAALNYRLPLFFGYDARLFQIGILLCIIISITEAILVSVPKKMAVDRRTWTAVFFYFFLTAASIGMADYDRLPTKIYAMLDYSLLFFVCLRCVKNIKDINLLLKGLVFVATLMALLGVIGFALDDPWWGQDVYDDIGINVARANASLSYGEKYKMAQEINNPGKFVGVRTRVASTAGDPNSFAILLLFSSFILAYFWLQRNTISKKLVIIVIASLLVVGVILSGSRTTMICGVISWLVFSYILVRNKKIKLRSFQLFSGLVILSAIVLISSSSQFLTKYTSQRVTSIDSSEALFSAEGRDVRWQNAVFQIPYSVLIIGRGHPGAQGTSGSHNTYLAILYYGGIWSLFAFFVFFIRSIRESRRMSDPLLGVCLLMILLVYAISGMTLENNHAVGPGYIFWPVIAILAKYKYMILKS